MTSVASEILNEFMTEKAERRNQYRKKRFVKQLGVIGLGLMKAANLVLTIFGFIFIASQILIMWFTEGDDLNLILTSGESLHTAFQEFIWFVVLITIFISFFMLLIPGLRYFRSVNERDETNDRYELLAMKEHIEVTEEVIRRHGLIESEVNHG